MDRRPKSGQSDFGGLLAVCTPLLYRQNAFRVIGLPIEAPTRAIKRRIDDLKAAAAIDDLRSEFTHALALRPLPNADDLREAQQKLIDPERRVIEEFFWFWPALTAESHSDPALGALEGGDIKTAYELWQDALRMAEDRRTAVAKHNLAVFFHLLALDFEQASLHDASSSEQARKAASYWRSALKYWDLVHSDDEVWTVFDARIRALDDPRLSGDLARRLREKLPEAIDKINAMLAIGYAERGDSASAERHLEYMRESHQGHDDVQKILALVAGPHLSRIRAALDDAKRRTEQEPSSGAQCVESLVETVQIPLGIVRLLLSDDNHERIDLCDAIAEACLACQIAFVRATNDWRRSLQILDAAAGIAESDDCRARIEENRTAIRSNLLLEPVLQDCRRATEASTADPASALEAASQLLASAPRALTDLSGSGASADVQKHARDLLAACALQCLVAYGNQFEAWSDCIPLLEKTSKLAASPQLRSRVEENLRTVRENSILEGLTPISSAPSLSTTNGWGFRLYGRSDTDPVTRSYLTTHYFVAFFLPLLPLARYRVTREPDGFRFFGKAPLRQQERVHLFVVLASALVLTWLALAGQTDRQSSPSRATVTTRPSSRSSPPAAATRPARPAPTPRAAVPAPSYQRDVGLRSMLGREIEDGKRRARELEQQLESLDSQIETSQSTLESYERLDMIDAYNGMVPVYNSLIERRRRLYWEYSQLVDDVNAKVARYNSMR